MSRRVLISLTFSSFLIFTPKLFCRATIRSTISRLSSPRSAKILASGTRRSLLISNDSSKTLLVFSTISCSVIHASTFDFSHLPADKRSIYPAKGESIFQYRVHFLFERFYHMLNPLAIGGDILQV